MKRGSKGKKSGIKGQRKKSLARYTTKWVKGDRKNDCFIVRKPEPPEVIDHPLKESAKAMNNVFNNPLGSVETPVTKVDERVRAAVIKIGDAPKLQRTVKPDKLTDTERKSMIEGLEKHIAATTGDKEREFVGPPKPPELSIISKHVPDEVIGKTSSSAAKISRDSVAANDLPKYGKLIKDVGEGMTPSGQPISSFLDGTWKPTSWVVQPVKLHSVTSDDYTHEEVAELYDLLQVEMMERKAAHQAHVDMLNEHINELGKGYQEAMHTISVLENAAVSSASEDAIRNRLSLTKQSLSSTEDALFNARQELKQYKKYAEQLKKDYYDSVSGNNDEAVIELQTENAHLDKENTELRQELEDLMHTVDQQARHYESNNSKAPLKTLANQYHIYASQHRDDPIRNFLRRSGYDISLTKDLKKYFDDECDVRVKLSNERGWLRKMARTTATEQESKWAVRRDTHWFKVMARKHSVRAEALPKPDWLCPKLHSVTEDIYMNHFSDIRLRPKATNNATERAVYCKVWADAKSLMTRQEFDAWRKNKVLEDKLASVQDTKMFKLVAPLVRAGKVVNKFLNYELNEATRGLEKETKRLQEIEASRIKREREAAFERSVTEADNLERIREAQRIAH